MGLLRDPGLLPLVNRRNPKNKPRQGDTDDALKIDRQILLRSRRVEKVSFHIFCSPLKYTRKIPKIFGAEVRQKSIFRNVEVRVDATGQLGHCATCKGSSYTKDEYNRFYHKLDAEYFYSTMYSTKAVFSSKPEKLFWGHI